MKKIFKTFLLIGGWVLLALFLTTTFIFNQFNSSENNFAFSPIGWSDHASVLDGALSCTLLPAELQDRLDFLKKEVFSKVEKKEVLNDGMIFYFPDSQENTKMVMDFIAFERQCCPFFKFDLSILPFEKGIALKISGSRAVKEFLESYMGDFT